VAFEFLDLDGTDANAVLIESGRFRPTKSPPIWIVNIPETFPQTSNPILGTGQDLRIDKMDHKLANIMRTANPPTCNHFGCQRE
jgi:hypothetical protein